MSSQYRTRNYSALDLVHFTVRGDRKRVIFFDGADHEEFLGGLRDRLDDTRWPVGPRLLAWAQMPNHQHVFLQLGSEPMVAPRIMRSLSTSYAISHNQRRRLRGPVFQHPFRGRIVQGGDHVVNTFAYIHLNPDASLREENSSHPVYAGDRTDPHLDPEIAWRAFGGRAGYLEFFADTARLRSARSAARQRLS